VRLDTVGGLYDPNKGRFDLSAAEAMLGIDHDKRQEIRMAVAIDLLLAHAGITEEQVMKAYSERIKNDVSDAAASLSSLVGEGFDAES
jgi:hypothetical protein